jgi:hypothetical protein
MQGSPAALFGAALILGGCSSASSLPSVDDAGPPASDGAALEDGPISVIDPYGGAAGCDGGIPTTLASCSIKMPLQGGLVETLDGGDRFSCGWVNDAPPSQAPSSVNTYVYGPSAPWRATKVTFTPTMPIVPGQPGPLDSVAVFIDATDLDGGGAAWLTPFTCSLTLSSNACVTGGSVPGLYAMSGTGTCADPAAPTQGNTRAPVTIGPFSFALEYGAPSTGNP